MSDSPAVAVVLVTAPSEAVAAELARAVVEARLAACGNIVPAVRSIYRWQDELQDDSEALLVLKTTPARVPALVARVTELHPYEVPEVLALPVSDGLSTYVSWVADVVRPQEKQ